MCGYETEIVIEILNNRIELDSVCGECVDKGGGFGHPHYTRSLKKDYQNGKMCYACKNRRFILTDEGEAIMKLINRHK